MKYDAFISHASEDKQSIVEDLVQGLVKIGCKVWYDEFSLKVGDSLSRSIDKGLVDSSFGVVILSKHFLSKDWPEYELRGLTTREIHGKSRILPVIHGIKIEDVSEYSPTLADKISLDTSHHDLEAICTKLLEIIRPDIYANLSRKILAERLYMETDKEWAEVLKQVNPVSAVPKKLSTSQIQRLRMIRGLLHPFLSQISALKWLDIVARSQDPEQEILHFENLCVAFMETARYMKIVTDTKKLNMLLAYVYSVFEKEKFPQMRELKRWMNKKDRAVMKEIMAGQRIID